MHSLFLVALFLTIVILVNAKRIPSQYEASCYPGCRCTKNIVTCENLHKKTPDLFEKYIPAVYTQLDTLVITGNDFGALPDEDLFGSNFRHEQLSVVNLTNNGIKYFGIQTFIGMPRVEYFYLSDNKLDSVGDQPFTYLTSLGRLELNNVFGTHVSVDARADIIRKIFQANHTFNHLKEIQLKGNQLRYLHPDTFCNVKGLERLILADNALEKLDFNPKCLEELKRIDLSNNRLTTIPKALYNDLSLHDWDVSKNPLTCDCELQPFIEYANERFNSFENQDNTVCGAPASLAGKKLFELDDMKLCRIGTSLFNWVILLLVAVGFLFGYRWFRRHGRSIRLPFTVGYSPLKGEEGPQPAFV